MHPEVVGAIIGGLFSVGAVVIAWFLQSREPRDGSPQVTRRIHPALLGCGFAMFLGWACVLIALISGEGLSGSFSFQAEPATASQTIIVAMITMAVVLGIYKWKRRM